MYLYCAYITLYTLAIIYLFLQKIQILRGKKHKKYKKYSDSPKMNRLVLIGCLLTSCPFSFPLPATDEECYCSDDVENKYEPYEVETKAVPIVGTPRMTSLQELLLIRNRADQNLRAHQHAHRCTWKKEKVFLNTDQ